MTCGDVMKQLEAWGDENARRLNARHGAGENQFGVNRSKIRTLAKELKKNHPLGLELWETGNVEASLLATLIFRPREFTEAQLDDMAQGLSYFQLTDWFVENVVKESPHKEALRLKWVDSDHEFVGRAGWSLTTRKVTKEGSKGLDLPAIVDRIEAEMKQAPYHKQWSMNHCLAEIGIHHPEHRERCLDIGYRLEVLKDYPTPKGCISPFAPIWITEMVARQG